MLLFILLEQLTAIFKLLSEGILKLKNSQINFVKILNDEVDFSKFIL